MAQTEIISELKLLNTIDKMSDYNKKLVHPNLYKILKYKYQSYSSHQKLIYLDHSVFRKMYKAINNKEVEDKNFWIQLYDILVNLIDKKKIFCPRSYLHEEETLLAEHDKNSLKEFSESLSRDIVLKFPEFILLQQTILFLERYIKGKTERKMVYSPADILVNKKLKPGLWGSYFNKSNPSEGIANQLQAARNHHSLIIGRALTEGRENLTKSFMDYVEFFHGVNIFHILKSFDLYIGGKFQLPLPLSLGIRKFYKGELSKNDLKKSNSVLMLNIISDFLIKNDKRDNISLEKKLEDFFRSNEYKEVPVNKIMNYLMASICIRGKNGQKKFNNHKSMMTDFETIAYYMPYCDIMYIDDECANLLNEKKLKEVFESYNTKIFSSKIKKSLIEYLEVLY